MYFFATLASMAWLITQRANPLCINDDQSRVWLREKFLVEEKASGWTVAFYFFLYLVKLVLLLSILAMGVHKLDLYHLVLMWFFIYFISVRRITELSCYFLVGAICLFIWFQYFFSLVGPFLTHSTRSYIRAIFDFFEAKRHFESSLGKQILNVRSVPLPPELVKSPWLTDCLFSFATGEKTKGGKNQLANLVRKTTKRGRGG